MRARYASCVVMLSCASVFAGQWQLGPATLIAANGEWPRNWSGSVAYLDGPGGAVMFFDGMMSTHIYGPDLYAYEPTNAAGTLAWRNVQSTASSSEIYRWDGSQPQNVSNSLGVIDSDLAAGSNGDLIWSQAHEWLWYYDASADSTAPLGIRGVHPAIYVTDAGIVTYAWQDPDDFWVYYFDGTTTHTVSRGAYYGAEISLYDGCVAWINATEGTLFDGAEVFFWSDGVMQRLTDDDAAGGIIDRFPTVWSGRVIWSRYPTDPFTPQLFMWDGADVFPLTDVGGTTPSYHGGAVAYVDFDGLYIADVLPPVGDGDMNCDGEVGFGDINPFVLGLTDPEQYALDFPDCTLLHGDINADGEFGFGDINPFVDLLLYGPGGI